MVGKKKTLHTVLQRAICLALSVALVAGLSLAPAFAYESKGGSGFDSASEASWSAVNGAVAQDSVQGNPADNQSTGNFTGNDAAAGGRNNTCDTAQRRTLSGSVGTDQRHDLTFKDFQVDALQSMDASVVRM